MSNYAEQLRAKANTTYTENGMEAKKSTDSAVLDLFATIGAMRSVDYETLELKVLKAYAEDPLATMKTIFYARDIRGGLGERRVPRLCLAIIANNHPESLIKNMNIIPHFGRWDDIFGLINTREEVEDKMWELVVEQLELDKKALEQPDHSVSLLGKWMPSLNTSSAETRALANYARKRLGMSQKQYRKLLSALRERIQVTERLMSNGRFDEIEYGGVPSLSMLYNKNSFYRNDGERFSEYVENLATGEEKVNASTLYPYDIIENYGGTYGRVYRDRDDEVLEAQWKALPNYVDEGDNVLIMADTSGSMYGRPYNTAIGLSLYFAERNTGAFKDMFMTFSTEPKIQIVDRNLSLRNRLNSIESIISDTNLEKAFELILDTAVENLTPPEELPKTLIVISDMQFNSCVCRSDRYSSYGDWDFYTEMKHRFNSKGYDIPEVIFWNVENRRDSFHASADYQGVKLVSGQSTSIFKQVLSGVGLTPYESMMETLNQERYDVVEI